MLGNHYVAGSIDLLLGGWLGYTVVHGMATGQIGIRNGVVDRDENIIGFHAIALPYAALSIWLLFGGVVSLFGSSRHQMKMPNQSTDPALSSGTSRAVHETCNR
jgi:hypothetical protein